MQRSDFSYHLPQERIAQTPAEPRDHSKLLHIDRATEQLSHHHFYDLPTLLSPGDVLVLNDTKVLPVRLAVTKSTGGKGEVLLTKRLSQSPEFDRWEALVRPGLKAGQVVTTQTSHGHQLSIEVESDQGMTRIVRVSPGGDQAVQALHALGTLPLPPYITQTPEDFARYQTVFAQHEGSAAAPTAGLHFTQQLLQTLQDQGVVVASVTLHVGLGTFLPVKVDDITKHVMHAEWYHLPQSTANTLNQAKLNGHRVIAVGTTAMRTLEAAALNFHDQPFAEHAADTNLFVYPPYQFRMCDGIITNFHLPESTLLMLISAFTSAPQTQTPFTTFTQSLLGRAYQEAIEHEYRFYSFGDAMFIS